MLFDRAVPLLNVGGVSQEHWDTFVVASSNTLMSTEPGGITAQYVEPSGTAFQAQAEALARDEASVREVSPFAWSVRNPPWESPPSSRRPDKRSSTRSLPASPGAAAARKPLLENCRPVAWSQEDGIEPEEIQRVV